MCFDFKPLEYLVNFIRCSRQGRNRIQQCSHIFSLLLRVRVSQSEFSEIMTNIIRGLEGFFEVSIATKQAFRRLQGIS